MGAEAVRAAGGVVLRRGPDGAPEVAVVHRPRYDDWTLPKGKLDPGESLPDAALREVEEETGLRCRLGEMVGETTYRDRHGRSKVVTYYAMTVEGGEFAPNDEVDELRWLSATDAQTLLTHARDRELIAQSARRAGL